MVHRDLLVRGCAGVDVQLVGVSLSLPGMYVCLSSVRYDSFFQISLREFCSVLKIMRNWDVQ